jgi:hypothetical protein
MRRNYYIIGFSFAIVLLLQQLYIGFWIERERHSKWDCPTTKSKSEGLDATTRSRVDDDSDRSLEKAEKHSEDDCLKRCQDLAVPPDVLESKWKFWYRFGTYLLRLH